MGRMILSNLTHGMRDPRVLDIKIGRRLYDIDASETKISKRKRKSDSTASGKHGFRFCGYYMNGVIKHKKDLFEVMESDQIKSVFTEFFEQNLELIRGTIKELLRIRAAVEESSVQLISSSILLTYDYGDPKKSHCKMIDFAHSHIHAADERYDENYLDGIESLIQFLREQIPAF